MSVFLVTVNVLTALQNHPIMTFVSCNIVFLMVDKGIFKFEVAGTLVLIFTVSLTISVP